jgi:DNA repair protein RadC
MSTKKNTSKGIVSWPEDELKERLRGLADEQFRVLYPSGAAEPSEADRLLPHDLLAASAPLGLRVLDHVIVAEEATYSFADSGLLDELALEAGVR